MSSALQSDAPLPAVAEAPAVENEELPDPGAARVRFHLKGESPGSGPVYQGQQISQPCLNCGRK